MIENKVAKSGLITFDLEDLYPTHKIKSINIIDFLHEGFLLKEKDFRRELKSIDWSAFNDCLVHIICSNDVVLPTWAPLLIQTYVTSHAKIAVLGTKKEVLKRFYFQKIKELNPEEFKDQRVILKGCSKKDVPQEAYLYAIDFFQPIVKSLMFGEACSTVPLFKRK